jgi:hypothetical protein
MKPGSVKSLFARLKAWYYSMNARFTDGHIMDETYSLVAFSIGFGI